MKWKILKWSRSTALESCVFSASSSLSASCPFFSLCKWCPWVLFRVCMCVFSLSSFLVSVAHTRCWRWPVLSGHLLSDPQSSLQTSWLIILQTYIILSVVYLILKLCCCYFHLLCTYGIYCIYWKRDPSSVALPGVSCFFPTKGLLIWCTGGWINNLLICRTRCWSMMCRGYPVCSSLSLFVL